MNVHNLEFNCRKKFSKSKENSNSKNYKHKEFTSLRIQSQIDRIYFMFPSAVLLQLDLSLIYFHINIYCFNKKLFILVIPKTHDTLAFTGLTRESPCVCLCSSSLDV